MLAYFVLALALHAQSVASHAPKAQVLLFIRTDCPVSNRYAPEIQRLYNVYSKFGIDFLLVYPESGLTAAAMQQHQREYGYSIPAVLDPDHHYVARAKVRVTPEAAVFVNEKLMYVGRIDDSYAAIGKRRTQPDHRDLDEELSAISAGKVPPFHQTTSVGCAIEAPQAR